MRTDNNISFKGFWANRKMNKALNQFKSYEPSHAEGCIKLDVFGLRRANIRIIIKQTLQNKVEKTRNLQAAIDEFTKAKPNKTSFKITEEIERSIPKGHLILKSLTSGKTITPQHPATIKTLNTLSETYAKIHETLSQFKLNNGYKQKQGQK